MIKKIFKNTYRINEWGPFGNVKMYLLIGDDKSLLIDSGYGRLDLNNIISKITDKPVEVFLTHGHIDHANGCYHFKNVFMDQKDTIIYKKHSDPTLINRYFKNLTIPQVETKEVPLGKYKLGNREVIVLNTPGHTPGSISIIDPYSKIAFVGDFINPWDTWLGLDESLSVEEYLNSLLSFKTEIEKYGINKIYSGHNEIAMSTKYVDDYITLCKQIINGDIIKAKKKDKGICKGYLSKYKRAKLIYKRDNVIINKAKRKKHLIISLSSIGGGVILSLGLITFICLAHFVGFPQCVGDTKYDYKEEEIHVLHDDINLFGKALIPLGKEEKYPLAIYAHGAESTYNCDYTTLKSLAMSGIATYAFDFYGWSTRSTGPKRGDFFKHTPRNVDNSYELQVLEQVKDLNAVIDKCKTLDFVDNNNVFLIGSSMGGATAATCAVTHSSDIKAMILQYPAINLNPQALVDGADLDANKYTNDVLILQGNKDKIVPLSMSEGLLAHYNKYNENHAEMIIYDGQPHVFTGKYKVNAARDIYKFIEKEIIK